MTLFLFQTLLRTIYIDMGFGPQDTPVSFSKLLVSDNIHFIKPPALILT